LGGLSLITTAVIPAAGLGTRLYPITHAIPKELVPVYDSIALFKVCEEAVRFGIQKIVIVNSPYKRSLADPVRRFMAQSSSLETEAVLPVVMEVIQEEPLGLGHAIHCAEDSIDQFPVVVMLPDVLLTETSDLLGRMLAIGSQDTSVVSVRKTQQPRLSQSGVVDYDGEMLDGMPIRNLVEKPAAGDEPSDRMVIGRYVLTKEIFKELSESVAGATGEIELTDSIAVVARSRPGAVVACEFMERYQDTGTIDGLFLAGLDQFAQVKSGTGLAASALELIELLESDLDLKEI
jgi:UTP--glucose-1-phosphate uridylyltransferase